MLMVNFNVYLHSLFILRVLLRRDVDCIISNVFVYQPPAATMEKYSTIGYVRGGIG